MRVKHQVLATEILRSRRVGAARDLGAQQYALGNRLRAHGMADLQPARRAQPQPRAGLQSLRRFWQSAGLHAWRSSRAGELAQNHAPADLKRGSDEISITIERHAHWYLPGAAQITHALQPLDICLLARRVCDAGCDDSRVGKAKDRQPRAWDFIARANGRERSMGTP